MTTLMLRRALAAATIAVAGLAVLLPPGAGAVVPGVCGLTTLHGTLAADPAHPGTLRCGPGQPLTVRADLGAEPKATRTAIRDALISFVAMSDFQLADEESPLRGEFLDKCEAGTDDESTRNPLRASFRWHETLIPELINAEVQAANAIARGPLTNRPFDFAVQLGDAADNDQWNEVRWFIGLLDGSAAPDRTVHLIDPDSGANGYEGVQSRDPRTGSPALGNPDAAEYSSLRDLANEPFFATGLRRPDGSQLPWYSVMGNHDMKVAGTVPNDDAWLTFARMWVVGDLKVSDLAPDQQERVCADPTLLRDPSFWTEVATTPGTTKLIQADARRRLLSRVQWIAEHLPSAAAKKLDAEAAGSYGSPAGHGFLTPGGTDNRCRDADGALLDRACYSFDYAADATLPTPIPLHFIALDTGADEGTDDGNLTPGEYEWLRRDLIAHSRSYFDDAGMRVTTTNQDSLIVVFSHHTESTTTNTSSSDQRYVGADLEKLLHRFPNVVLHANGHTHYNKVWAHPDPDGRTGGYWEINTSAIADWPHMSRTIEITDNHDGTLSIIGVNFDAAVPPNPRSMPWTTDSTQETKLKRYVTDTDERVAINHDVNEAWLASAAREIGYSDPQSGHGASYGATAGANATKDQNVELVIKNPFGTTRARAQVPVPNPPGFIPFPQPPINPFFPPPQPPSFDFPKPPPQFPPAFGTTGPGIGVPAKSSGPSVPYRAGMMIVAAVAGSFWVVRARVRSWMIGH
jgi:metallophosphoesterase (TIGR03767 family)